MASQRAQIFVLVLLLLLLASTCRQVLVPQPLKRRRPHARRRARCPGRPRRSPERQPHASVAPRARAALSLKTSSQSRRDGDESMVGDTAPLSTE